MTAAVKMAAPVVGTAVDEAARALAAAGIDEPRREARILIAHVLGAGTEYVIGHPERELSQAESDAIAALVAARCARRPLAQVLGRREFWSLEFKVTEETLDPRPDSECVVETALRYLPRDARLRLLDLGTGTGCLLLALLHELPEASGLGVDISEATLAVAEANAEALGLTGRARFACGDWGEGIDGPFDAIVTNPPYIPEGELARLQPEVARFEPRMALNGGQDGLESYRALAPQIARLLAPGGWAFVECGAGQAGEVVKVMAAAGLVSLETARDLAGRERVAVLRKPAGKASNPGKKGLE